MPSTEVQRIVLLIGLAVTAYLMILAWNDDYVKQQEPVEVSAEPSVEDTPAPAPEAAAPEESRTAPASDVPDMTLLSEEEGEDHAPRQTPAPSTDAETGSGARLVKVTTDTLELWIDLFGGDIVRVQLPQHKASGDTDRPYLLLDRGDGHVYIAQSGLWGSDVLESGGGRLRYRASASHYTLTGDQPLTVALSAERDGISVTKSFRFEPGRYVVTQTYRLENHSGAELSVRQFGQIKRDDENPYGTGGFKLGPKPYLGAALTTDESRYEKLTFDDMTESTFKASVQGGWIAFLQHYFLSAWIPDQTQRNSYFGQRQPDGTFVVGYSSPRETVADGATATWESRFFAGPKDQNRLETIAPNLNLTVDYGFLWWLAVPLFKILDFIHGVVGNWGVSIILLTVLVKLALYPLSSASYRSMANMRRVAPQMKRLQERYADDRQKLSQEMMALYKKEKVNPLGGCLPMLLPMPIFIALYWVLFESVELRHAPFMLWIHDLSAMDPYFVLPLLMGGSMFLMQLMSPAMGDPMQQKMMRLMPIMFTVLFLFFPAGLVLYWLVNNLLSMAQQYYIMRQTEGKQAART